MVQANVNWYGQNNPQQDADPWATKNGVSQPVPEGADPNLYGLGYATQTDEHGTVKSQDYSYGSPALSGIKGYQFTYAAPDAFKDKNAGNVYRLIQSGIDNTNQVAPMAALTALGNAAQYGGTTINTGADAALQQAQGQYINQLNQQAQGLGPSVGSIQAKQAADRAIQSQMAMLASARGSSNPALAQRAAMDQGSQLSQAGIQAGALARAQEQLGAQAQLGQALGTTRSQTQAIDQAQANLYNQAALTNQAAANQYGVQQGTMNQAVNLANQQAQQAQNTLGAQQYGQMLQAYMNQNQNDLSNQAAFQQLLGQQQMQAISLGMGKDIQTTNNTTGLAGAGVSALAGIGAAAAAASDSRLKKDIKSANAELKNFLQAIRGK